MFLNMFYEKFCHSSSLFPETGYGGACRQPDFERMRRWCRRTGCLFGAGSCRLPFTQQSYTRQHSSPVYSLLHFGFLQSVIAAADNRNGGHRVFQFFHFVCGECDVAGTEVLFKMRQFCRAGDGNNERLFVHQPRPGLSGRV